MTENQTLKSVADQLNQAEEELRAAQARVEQLRMQLNEEPKQAGQDVPEAAPQGAAPQGAAEPDPQFAQQPVSFGQPTGQPYAPPQDFAQFQQASPAYWQTYQNPQPYASQPGNPQGYWGGQQFAAPPYGAGMQNGIPAGYATKDHVAAGLLAIFLGALGVHKFYLGYNTAGFIMLAVSVIGGLVFGLGLLAMSVVGLIEGILYLTKSQTEFERTYLLQEKSWF